MLKFLFVFLGLILMAGDWFYMIVVLMLISGFWFFLLQSYSLGILSWVVLDNLSFMLVCLSVWLTALMYMSSYYIVWLNNNNYLFGLTCTMMVLFLLLTFSTSDFLVFYIMFESTLVPIFLMILGWGYQPERVRASYYLLFYTLTASLPLLLGLLWVYVCRGSLFYNMVDWGVSGFFVWVFVLAFFVKMPVYLFHLWLPSAHVEAPVAGSMILAGLLLKLGGYGLYRMILVLGASYVFQSYMYVVISLVGGTLATFVCLRQVDVKSLVAYSSVAHMALVLLGLSLNSVVGVLGAFVIMMAHGLCSSGLFSLVGLFYNRLSSRSILMMRGSLGLAPLLALWWFLFSVANMAAPPTPNLAGEILVFMSMVVVWKAGLFFLGVMSFLGAAYNLYMYSSVQHGSVSLSTGDYEDASMNEHIGLFYHFFPLLLLLVYMLSVL